MTVLSRLLGLPALISCEFGGWRQYFRHQGGLRHGLVWLRWHVAPCPCDQGCRRCLPG